MSLLIQFSYNNNLLPNKFTINNPSKQNLISLLKSFNLEIFKHLNYETIDLYINNQIINESISNIKEEEISIIEIRENTYISGAKTQLSGHKGPILCLDVLSDSDNKNYTVVSGGADKTVRLWRNGLMTNTFLNHTNWVQIVKIKESKENNYEIISGSMDGRVYLQRNSKENSKEILLYQFKESITCLDFYKDNIIASSRDKSVKLISKEKGVLSSFTHLSKIRGFHIFRDFIYSFCDKSFLNIYFIEENKFKFIKQIKLKGFVTKMTDNGEFLFAGTNNGYLYFIKDNQILFKKEAHNDLISSLGVYRDLIVSASFDKKLMLHDFKGKMINEFFMPFPIYAMDTSKNFIAVGGGNGLLRVYDTNKMVREINTKDDIYDIKVLRNKIIVASKDTNLYIFQ